MGTVIHLALCQANRNCLYRTWVKTKSCRFNARRSLVAAVLLAPPERRKADPSQRVPYILPSVWARDDKRGVCRNGSDVGAAIRGRAKVELVLRDRGNPTRKNGVWGTRSITSQPRGSR